MNIRNIVGAAGLVAALSFGQADDNGSDSFTFEGWLSDIGKTWTEAWGDESRIREGMQVDGTCKVFEGRRTVYVCVPTRSPNGGTILRLWEDGSARYSDGFVVDTTGEFSR